MSPSEADLRAALHDGDSEGDGVAAGRLADRVMARARRRRAQTRSRLLSTAAVTVVVAAGGTGLGLLGGQDGGSAASGGSAATSVANGAAAAGSAVPGAPRSSSATIHGLNNTGSAASAAARCPAQLPRYVLSGAAVPSASADTSTAHGPLFGEPVTSLVLCAYGSAGSPAQDVLHGASAHELVTSLEAASTTRPAGFCSFIQPVDAYNVALIGTTAAGRSLRPVTATVNVPACRVRVTNGTAVRYGWMPPVGVAGAMLARLGASVAAQSAQQSLERSPAGHMTGSPARS